MYTKLTKVTIVDGKECVSCINFGTEMCQVHNGTDCGHCPMFGVILNQLHTFEEVLLESADKNKQ